MSDYAIPFVDLVRIRPVGRHLSKVLYSTTVNPAYGIKVKVAELEYSFSKFYSYVFKDLYFLNAQPDLLDTWIDITYRSNVFRTYANNKCLHQPLYASASSYDFCCL